MTKFMCGAGLCVYVSGTGVFVGAATFVVHASSFKEIRFIGVEGFAFFTLLPYVGVCVRACVARGLVCLRVWIFSNM